jgi:predicted metal-dependent hydrolase
LSDQSQIQFGSKTISFDLEYQKRKTLGITVRPDGSVLVKAPEGSSQEKLEEKLRKRAPWILKQQSYFLSFEPRTPARQFISGETHLYLGKRYRLKIISGEKEEVKLKGKFLTIETNDSHRAESLLKAWYHAHARQKFQQLARPWISRFEKYGVAPTGMTMQWMEKRWGSCTPKGRIILNLELIKTPRRCIEYVIVHELCHLVHHNHSKAFFELQTKEMPDWEVWKERLERALV